MTDVRAEANAMRERLVSWRRDLHAHPELSFEERRTAAIVAEHLQRLGYCVRTGLAQTGVIGVLEGSQPGPTLMFRFDMDALPLEEETGAPYASVEPGRMHACGHDGHVAIGMGLAELLAARRERMQGTALLLFQPGEESGRGASLMIEDGAMEDPRPDLFFAAHIWNTLPVGTVSVSAGPVMAAADQWACVVHGKVGHGAQPHQAIDPIVTAAQMVGALQTIVSRSVDPRQAVVVTVGSIHGGNTSNVIPTRVEMEGTIRTFDPGTRETVLRRAGEIVAGIASANGTRAELQILALHPPVINDAGLAEVVREAAAAVVGPENVTDEERSTGAEDACDFMRDVPGCFFFLGSANPEQGLDAAHHNPAFDFDEQVLVDGLAVFAQVAERYLVGS